MRIQDTTQMLVFVNTTEETIFVNLSGDNNIHRGIELQPGVVSICICEFQRRRKAFRSRNRLHVNVKPQPYSVIQNIQLRRYINTEEEEERFIIVPKYLHVPSLLKLATATQGVVPPPHELFPYKPTDWIFPNHKTIEITYWECHTVITVSHWWICIPSCKCENTLMNTNSSDFNFRAARVGDFPHTDCEEIQRRRADPRIRRARQESLIYDLYFR